MISRRLFCSALVAVGMLAATASQGQERYITVASTTSTEQSGLFGYLLPAFEKATGIKVHVIAQGTGQALATGRHGDADVLFVHDKEAELKFVDEGYGVNRHEVMYNDFIVVGPKSDPAKAAGKNILEGFRRIEAAKAPFVSRGDKSGTNAAELRYWKAAGIDIDKAKGAWYRDTGSGMGPALNTASAMNAYILADRGTWLNFKNRGELGIIVEGDTKLFNQYGVMLVNPAKQPNVNVVDGQKFIDWLISDVGQKTIADYRIGGEQLFFPNAQR